MELLRRDFLGSLVLGSLGRTSAALAAATLVPGALPAMAADSAAPPEAADWPVAVFSKVFQKCSYDELADLVLEIGADGVETPIRGGGHIEPSQAATEVPKMVAALARRDKRLLIAATDIVTADARSEAVLRALAEQGVSHYRTGYYLYSGEESRWDQLRRFTDQAQALAELNQRIGIVGVYQNHAGPRYVGSVLWDLAQLMHQIQSPWLGVALDLRHTRAEIGVSWQALVDLIQPSVRTIFAKNTAWRSAPAPPSASSSPSPSPSATATATVAARLTEVPLADGMADRAMFRRIWQAIRPPAPLSVHVEYLGQQPRALAETAELVAAYRRDVDTLRQWMQPAG